ncbi:MAG: cell division FtsA domain-containing protein [Evtepia sp.]
MTIENQDQLIFALDIGTRSVIGIVGLQDGDMFRVICTDREEYQNRAVVDGQIEDIAETSKIAARVKERMEQALGFPLRHVYIAAAGRVLRTMEAEYQLPIPDGGPITASFLSHLAQNAIQYAYEQLGDREESFFCVGHAVKKYQLDDYEISNLLDHKGQTASISLIATFLPREVIESLYATMNHVGLSISGMTLEPIAAMNAIIPEGLRKLNLALCDIGAGTSDIALCSDGKISGYTMATIAGDEITEMIMQHCLVDFATAEQIKYRLSKGIDGSVTYENILGLSTQENARALFDSVKPAVAALARAICTQIMQAGSRPAAVFLVGGGSQTFGLRELIAKGLALDVSRVAIGSPAAYIKRVVASETDVFGPEYATPLGIALTAAQNRWGDSFSVTINDEKLHLINSWDSSVLGVLQMSGYRYSQILGRAGKPLYYELNGERKTLRGDFPEISEISLNGKPAALSTAVSPGDTLSFQPARQGTDAGITLKEATRHMPPCAWLVNGQPQDADYRIQTGDSITRKSIALDLIQESLSNTSDAQQEQPSMDSLNAPLRLTLNGESLDLPPTGTVRQFFDLLSYTDIDPKNPQGNIVLLLNGKSASYLQILNEGDKAQIYWEKQEKEVL